MSSVILSVIIPAYNSEKYIQKCLESIMMQSMANIEIIVVNDGSTDKTGEICDYIRKKHDNIRVITTKNGGQARARNIGLKKATGKYIVFADSDDYFCEDIGKNLLKKIQDDPDLIVIGHKKSSKNIKIKKCACKQIPNKIMTKEEMVRKRIYNDAPWCKVIKKEILIKNNLYFPEGELSEDIIWCAELLKNINEKKIKIIQTAPYIYMQHSESTSKKITKSHFNNIIRIFETVDSQEENDSTVMAYYSYEYLAMIGTIYSNSGKQIGIKEKKKLLKYGHFLDYGKRRFDVKCARVAKNLVGISMTANILGSIVNLKRHVR